MQRWFGQNDVLCMHEYLQVYQGRPNYTPERRLMAAVLRDAIDCYITDCFNVKRNKKRSYREAEEWFFSGDDHGVFSLYNVCGFLALTQAISGECSCVTRRRMHPAPTFMGSDLRANSRN
jgi:hypothetical protein